LTDGCKVLQKNYVNKGYILEIGYENPQVKH